MLLFREELSAADTGTVRDIVASTGFFNDEETAIAVELVEERLRRGDASGYHFVFAVEKGVEVGYACYGPIAGTEGRFDLYWIVVRNDRRGRGLGQTIMDAALERIRRMGGTRVYVETSSRGQYDPTRAFYATCGFAEAAVVEDFYAPGDSKVILVADLATA